MRNKIYIIPTDDGGAIDPSSLAFLAGLESNFFISLSIVASKEKQ